ncbi:MAG: hypothetical protein WD035_04925 [Balneolaceae bacterium]
MNTSDPHKHFQHLLAEIRSEIDKLKAANRILQQENTKLKKKSEEATQQQNDVFSEVSESERMAMKNRIDGLISKIDRHLNE